VKKTSFNARLDDSSMCKWHRKWVMGSHKAYGSPNLKQLTEIYSSLLPHYKMVANFESTYIERQTNSMATTSTGLQWIKVLLNSINMSPSVTILMSDNKICKRLPLCYFTKQVKQC
jgi:hypothetical protein